MERQVIALDLRKYSDEARLSSLPSDTASLAIEASETGIARVNPHFFIKRGADHVIAPGRDKRDVLGMFVENNNDPATKAAKEIRMSLLKDKVNTSYVWISSPGPWPEARLEIGAKKLTKSGRFEYQKCYGISTSLTREQCLSIGQLLASVSSENTAFPETCEGLRKTVMKIDIPENQDPFEYLSKLIELPEKNIWGSILNGQADKNKAKALKAAMIATETVRLNPHVIYSSPIEYGAYVETRMKQEGYGMDPAKFGCGTSNTSLTSRNFSFTETITGSIGHEDQFGSLDFPCPHCGEINTRSSGQLISNCQHCGGDVRC